MNDETDTIIIEVLDENREDAHDLRLIREAKDRNVGKPRVSSEVVNKMFGV